ALIGVELPPQVGVLVHQAAERFRHGRAVDLYRVFLLRVLAKWGGNQYLGHVQFSKNVGPRKKRGGATRDIPRQRGTQPLPTVAARKLLLGCDRRERCL